MAANLDKPKDNESLYTNIKRDDKKEVENGFEDRFDFHDATDLPPPIPIKPYSYRNTLRPICSSPRTLGRKPQAAEEEETSFETTSSGDNSNNIGIIHMEKMLLHDTLKHISVEKVTKKEIKQDNKQFYCRYLDFE